MLLLKAPQDLLSRGKSAQGTSLYLGERLLARFWLLEKEVLLKTFSVEARD
jgi:hypothetical protein